MKELTIEDVNIFLEGDSWCATLFNFINLQESPAGFGFTQDEALENLNKELQA
jgi:hypothetical protein